MSQYMIMGIYVFITKKGKTSAREIAEHFEISTRSVYRYLDSLSLAGIPIVTKNGRGGGVYIMEDFKLV